ncbi:sporulation protein [Falsibacillus pallidus]|uniref:sporulation protein n=1 Tax=Falsibacillus pallidus TaxID=493781 RepID=UPI003D98AB24
MWKEFLSSVGIGSMKVDTIVHEPKISRPGKIEGEVVIHGGSCDQKVEGIDLRLVYRYEAVKEESDFTQHEKDIHEETIESIEMVKANEIKRIPFTLMISNDHPVSVEENETILRTTVRIPNAVDPFDEDKIIIY